jgi:hypothetical protein
MISKPEGGSASYEVGYGNPPKHTRFRKGQSGNPGGRPRGIAAGGLRRLVVNEAYRKIKVKEGDDIVHLPTIQAIVRASFALAAKGNGPAQRALIMQLGVIERELAAETAAHDAQAEETCGKSMTDIEIARRVAFVLLRGQNAAALHATPASNAVDGEAG